MATAFECQAQKIVAEGKSSRFVSEKFGFSVPVPRGWFVSIAGDTPFYFNFSPSAQLGQGELPARGATINITAQEDLPSRRGRENIDDWAQADEDQGIAETIIHRTVSMPSETGIRSALWTAYDLKRFTGDQQAQHQVNLYWQFKGRLFATHLVFVKSREPQAGYEKILTGIMDNLRPIK